MAKLKQKGFQGHPLAKEQKAEEQTSSKVDEEEVQYQVKLSGGESFTKSCCAAQQLSHYWCPTDSTH